MLELSKLEIKNGNLDEAINYLNKIVKEYPKNFNAWYALAEVYTDQGKWDDALLSFNKCIEIQPENANSFFGKAKINFLLK